MDKMINKKAIELSLNFIVIIIISIIIFGFGVKFISDLSSHATEITDMTISELDERIEDLICEGSERVCVGIDRKTIRRKEFDVFGLKIVNILESQDFDIAVLPPEDYLGYKRDGTEIDIGEPRLIVNPESRTASIKQNEGKKLGIGIQVPANAASGTYILNVEIETDEGVYSKQKLYVDVP